jgi:hypothetical protein
MRAARGTHFAFLDADDVWIAEKIERQLDAISGCGAEAAAVCGYVIADEHLNPVRAVIHQFPEQALERALRIEAPGIGLSFTGLAPRAAVERVGGFDERLSVSADLEFAWRLAGHCRLVTAKEPLALHRRHSRSQMHRDVRHMVKDMDVVLRTAEANGLSRRSAERARANLRVYAAARLLLQGERRSGGAELLLGSLHHPVTPLRLLARLAIQRAQQKRDLRPIGDSTHGDAGLPRSGPVLVGLPEPPLPSPWPLAPADHGLGTTVGDHGY